MTNLTRNNFQAHPHHLVSPSPWPLNTYFVKNLISKTRAFYTFSVQNINSIKQNDTLWSFVILIITSLYILRQYYEDNTLINFIVYSIILISICLLNFKLKIIDFKLITKSIKFRICITLLVYVFGYLNLNMDIIYGSIIYLILISLILSKNKLNSILKLLFIVSFWCIFTICLVYILKYLYFNSDYTLSIIMCLFITNYIALELPGDLNDSNLNLDNYNLNLDGRFEYMKSLIIDLIKLKDILLKYLLYYIQDGFELYSNLNPENSGEILKVLHQLLQESNLKYLNSGGPGGGGWNNWNPIFTSYKGLFIESDEDPNLNSWKRFEFSRNDERFEELKNQTEKYITFHSKLEKNVKIVDDFNKSLDYPKKNEMINEKNDLIKRHAFLDYNFQTPYSISLYDTHGDFHNFFPQFKLYLDMDIHIYNELSAAKYYYEHKNKEILHPIFESLWYKWHMSQVNIDGPTYYEWARDINYNNFYKKEVVYGELNDNLLILGLTILCKIDIFQKLYNEYGIELDEAHARDCYDGISDLRDANKFEIYSKSWEYYQECLKRYYPFFDHYNWYCKLFSIDEVSKGNIIYNLSQQKIFMNKVLTVPPLSEEILFKYPNLSWNKSIPVYKYPIYKWYISPMILGMPKAGIEWVNFEYFLGESPWTVPKEYPLSKLSGMLGLGKTYYDFMEKYISNGDFYLDQNYLGEMSIPSFIKPSLPQYMYEREIEPDLSKLSAKLGLGSYLSKLPGMLGLGKTIYDYTNMKNLSEQASFIKPSLPQYMYWKEYPKNIPELNIDLD